MTEDEYYKLSNQPLNRAIVDFDDTLAKGIWPKRGIGKPLHYNIKKLDILLDNGYSIWIFTSRPSSDEPAIIEWLERNNVPYDKVITGKPVGDIYVDDKAVYCEDENWI
jgi:hypothetical protein